MITRWAAAMMKATGGMIARWTVVAMMKATGGMIATTRPMTTGGPAAQTPMSGGATMNMVRAATAAPPATGLAGGAAA